MSELWELGAVAVANAIRTGEANAADAVDACIGRIDSINGDVNAVTVVYGEQARAAAVAADQRQSAGESLGPLHGVPFAVKENIDVEGWPTTWGVPAFSETLAPRDAPIVAQLKAAGAIPIAATNLPDFALRWHTDSSLRGVTRNPWDGGRTPGGSSGGSAAALATGMVPLALGNDLGGSLRYPAQCCGVASLRPSHGRIARANATMPGELPTSFQLMYVEGPMARNVVDLQVALAAVSNRDPCDPWWVPAPLDDEQPSALPKIALTLDPGALGVDPQVAAGVHKAADALSQAGYTVEEADPPQVVEAMQMWQQLLWTEVRVMLLDTIKQLSTPDAPRSLELCDPFVPDLDKTGFIRTFADRNRMYRDWLAFFERYPLILGPVSMDRPFQIGEDVQSTERSRKLLDSMRLVVAINLLGLPVAVVPTGIAEELPQAVQIIGSPFAESRCLHAAAVVEAAVGTITPIAPR